MSKKPTEDPTWISVDKLLDVLFCLKVISHAYNENILSIDIVMYMGRMGKKLI